MAISKIVTNSVDSGVTLTSPTLVTPVLSGSITGTYTLAGTGTLSSPIISGTPTGVGVLTSGTAVASTSGTSIDFTGIPSWVKRITVMFNGVSTNGSSKIQIQIGAGSVEATGYSSLANFIQSAASSGTAGASTTGFLTDGLGNLANTRTGIVTIVTMGSNLWAYTSQMADVLNLPIGFGAGSKTTSGTLDRVRITTVNGTDTFDAGSINILYE